MSPKPAPPSPLDGRHSSPHAQATRWDTPAGVLAMSQWFSPHTRSAVCGVCGATFTQHHLSERFLAMARSKTVPLGAKHAIDRQIPDGWVPLYCPPCEHHDLSAPDSAGPGTRVTAKVDERYLEDERAAMADSVEVG